MKEKLFIIFLLLIIGKYSFAQNSKIGGKIKESQNLQGLADASVTILNVKDSTLFKFVFSRNSGEFILEGVKNGRYLLLISYPEYADYVDTLDINYQIKPEYRFDNILLQLKSRLLNEVIVRGQLNAIKIKGDTTEFNAKAYVIQPNAKVEDLLKQLPGIQVDRNGRITANGQAVGKVLVDGEEFFGDDPTLVTKNIRADMVDRIQLFDKKSDQATFTGIDDGTRTKTINVKLREDKNKGLFGKAEGGVGTDGYYQSQAFINKFEARQKYAVYGTIANTGKAGLGVSDESKIGANNNIRIGDDGVINITGGRDELSTYNGAYSGLGIPEAKTGGAHYDTKSVDGHTSLNTNYKIGSIDVKGENITEMQQNLPIGGISTNTNQLFENYAFRQKLDATYKGRLDSTSNFQFGIEGTIKNFHTFNNFESVSRRENLSLLNSNNRIIDNQGRQDVLDASALYTKKFKKAGNTFSWGVSESYINNDTQGTLNSKAIFYNQNGQQDSTLSTNQEKVNNTKTFLLSSNMTYSQALSKTLSGIVNYGFGLVNSNADRRTYDQLAIGQSGNLDTLYSNSYKFNQIANQVGLIINYRKNKTLVNFGTKASLINYEQFDKFRNNTLNRNFIIWAPQARYQYRFSQQAALNLRYTGSSVQPTIDQIQPIRTNNDPLNIVLGNPNLKPSFTNRVELTYNLGQPVKDRSLFLSGNYSLTANPISSSTVTDATSGKSTIKSVNISKNSTDYYLGLNLNKRFAKPGLDLNTYFYTSGNIFSSFINGALNQSQTHAYSAMLSLQKNKTKQYSFSASVGPNYSVSQFSIQSQLNNNAFGFDNYESATVFIKRKCQLSTDISYNYKAKTNVFDAQSRTLWNATVSRTFFKSDNLKVSISGYDLLDQNVKFNRYITTNSITQSTGTGIKRYFMFSVSWDFTKFGTKPQS